MNGWAFPLQVLLGIFIVLVFRFGTQQVRRRRMNRLLHSPIPPDRRVCGERTPISEQLGKPTRSIT